MNYKVLKNLIIIQKNIVMNPNSFNFLLNKVSFDNVKRNVKVYILQKIT